MPKRIELGRSLVSVGLWLFVHGALLWLVWRLGLDQVYWLLALPVLGWLARQCWHDDKPFLWLEPPISSMSKSAHWRIGRDDQVVAAELTQAFAHPWLSILKFQTAERRYTLVLWPDSASQDNLCYLRFLCSTAIS